MVSIELGPKTDETFGANEAAEPTGRPWPCFFAMPISCIGILAGLTDDPIDCGLLLNDLCGGFDLH